MSATYTLTQMIYSFTFSANAVGGLSFDNSKGAGLQAMQTYVTAIETAILQDTKILGMIGTDWAPVWGPIVVATDTSGPTVHADNTMGCYYSLSQNMFVVAIAGTNPNSPFDWLNEDFAVDSMVPWSTVSGTGSGNISKATATGLAALLGMKDGSGHSLLQGLSAYIKEKSVTKAVVAVGGHSLAGALSPCLALYLFNNPSLWDPSGTQTLAAYPTAGPTPGDSGFASYYGGLITAGSITYASLYNTLDVVPLAWDQAGLEALPSIYNATIVPVTTPPPADALTGILASGMQVVASYSQYFRSNPYTQISQGRTALPGTFDTEQDGKAQVLMSFAVGALSHGTLSTYGPYLTNAVRFAMQAVAQHTTSYPPLLNIADFNTEYQTILKKNAPSNAATANGVHVAVKRLTGVDLSKVLALQASRSEKTAT